MAENRRKIGQKWVANRLKIGGKWGKNGLNWVKMEEKQQILGRKWWKMGQKSPKLTKNCPKIPIFGPEFWRGIG